MEVIAVIIILTLLVVLLIVCVCVMHAICGAIQVSDLSRCAHLDSTIVTV